MAEIDGESAVVDNNAADGDSDGSVEGQMQQIDGNSSRKITCEKAESTRTLKKAFRFFP